MSEDLDYLLIKIEIEILFDDFRCLIVLHNDGFSAAAQFFVVWHQKVLKTRIQNESGGREMNLKFPF